MLQSNIVKPQHAPLPLPLPRRLLAGTLVLGLLLVGKSVFAAVPVRGVVVDPAGAAVAGATVVVRGGAWRLETLSDERGRFSVILPAAVDVELTVHAEGFADSRVPVAAARVQEPLRITLALPGVSEEVIVSASRTETTLGSTAASAAIVSRAALDASPALALDETLRQVPGFTLFRRTGSLTANPTSQGVSLRGLGASGASRALVLDEGVPLNDPFGGWVYWDRIPAALLERAEIVRGGGSDLYGSGAVAGIVNLVRRRSPRPFVRADAFGGSLATQVLSVAGGASVGRWTMAAGGEARRLGGYRMVAVEQRGAVDARASSQHLAGDVSVSRRFGEGATLFLRGSLFGESRGNGTPLQVNSTRAGQVTVGGQRGWMGGEVVVRGYASRQVFNQSFSSVSADRATEQLVRVQRVPSGAAGASVQWARAARRHLLVLGAEGRRVEGTTEERLPGPAADWRARTEAGGTQWSGAVFAGDTVTLRPSFSLTLSLRRDVWRNLPAPGGTGASSGGAGAAPGVGAAERTDAAFSPRVGAVYRLGDHVSLAGSAYGAFRAPTLNELYRSFRLGNILTEANDALSAERLRGVEGGVRYAPSARVLLSGRVFSMKLDDAVANVTIAATPSLILRQRQNLGRVSSAGLEVDGEARLPGPSTLRLSYLFDSAVVSRFPADPRLEGLRVPQQARHTLAFGGTIARPWLGLVSLDGRWMSDQFDDDQNAWPLAPCVVAGAAWSRPVVRGLAMLAAAENLFDARCEVGRTPVTLLGAPRALRLGVRLEWGRVLQ